MIAYEKEAEQMSQELMREGLLTGMGQKETFEISSIYETHAELFSQRAVERRLANTSDERRKNLAFYAVDGYMGMKVKELAEELVNAEMSATVDFGGDAVAYRAAPVIIQNEINRTKRQEYESVFVDAVESFNGLRRKAWKKIYKVTKTLGFSNYRDMCGTLGRLRLEWLYDSTGRILDATNTGWRELVAQALASVGAAPQDGNTADIGHYLRAREFDAAFPAERLVPALKETLAAMGLDIDAQKNFHLDIEDRPLKSPRAFCSPVRIPDEVWLVIKPHGGQDDYNSILHEAGHAEHFVNTDASLPYALRGLGDTSVTESYAFLFNNLLFNEEWLNQYLGKRDWQPYLKFNKFSETWMLRRYSAKLRYEWELHAGKKVDGPELYSQILGEHLGVKIAPERYLVDVDDAFYVAQYLRAWHLEAQLRQMLEQEFGSRWFTNRDAGKKLVTLWKMGESMDAWQMAEWLGFGGLDAGPLIQSLTQN